MSAVARLKLIVAYDGTPFRGWQSQHGGNTIQDHLEQAFAAVCGPRVVVHGAGRTDAGVHAEAQCAHADVPRDRLPIAIWSRALNARLPREIRVLRLSRARKDFHARFTAKNKIYTYRIWNDRIHSPFEISRSWHLHLPLDLARLKLAAALLTGTHDFAGFAAHRGKPEHVTVRTLTRIQVKRRGPLITLRFEGDGFLYKMVRLITGMLVRCAQGRVGLDVICRIRDAKGQEKTSFAAPACGLYLTRVNY
jgi:tRNA pseudouridine38-40 synthase